METMSWPRRTARAAGAFFGGLVFQLLTLTGGFVSDGDDKWLRRGEWTAYILVALLAVAALVFILA